MDDTLYQRIKKHVEEGEKRIFKTYRDSKGLLTAGAGFKVTDVESFARLPFLVKDAKTGQLRPAKDDEKRKEFERIKGMSKTQLEEDPNAFTLDKAGIDTTLKSEIEDRVGKIKGEIAEADWEKLTDGQKAAVLDIHYANGSLKEFSNLKDAIKRGDAEGMAKEAGFHSGGKRNWEREARNQAAILGVSQEEGRRIVQDKFKDEEPTFDGPVAPSTPHQEPDPAPTAAKPETDSAPTPAPAEPPKEPKPDTHPEHNVPNTPTDPRAAAIVEMSKAPLSHPGEAALVKPVETWTEGEMKDALAHAQTGFKGWRSGDPMKAVAYERVQDWHSVVYGDGEQEYDGGKPVEPRPVVAIPQQPTPPRTPQGEDLYQAAGRIGRQVAEAAATEGVGDAVKSLQRGLNLLGQQPMPARSPAWGPATPPAPLAEDGQYGPRTDFALKQAVGRFGAPKVDDALALGRFNTFARNAQRSGSVDGLEDKTHAIFGPLLRGPADTQAPKVEAGVLQQTINDIGGGRHDDWTPLKVDDWIGPKTTEAFGRVLKDEDADSLTTAFGKGLGLL